jgi:hypothetical protein
MRKHWIGAAVLLTAIAGTTLPQGQKPRLSGIVAGRVTAADGTPVPDVVVSVRPVILPPLTRVLEARPQGADEQINWAVRRTAKTDAAGRYRIDDVPPGRHYISAGATYHPDALTMDKAQTISVAAGSVQEGIDIRQPQGFKVSGRLLIAPTLARSSPMVVSLSYGARSLPGGPRGGAESGTDIPDTVTMETVVRPDLTFEFLNVPRGSVQVSARRIGLPQRMSDTNVLVVDRNVTGIQIGEGPAAPRLTGRVVPHPAQSVPLPSLFVATYDGSAAAVNPDGTFEFLAFDQPGPLSPREISVRSDNGRAFNGEIWGAATLPATGVQPAVDIRDFEIPLKFGALISGRVRLDTGLAADAPFPVEPMIIEAKKNSAVASIWPSTYSSLSAQDDAWPGDSFQLPLLEGRYRFEVRQVPEGYRITGITSGDVDLMTTALEIAPGRIPKEIQVTLAPTGIRLGTISGRILYPDGTPAFRGQGPNSRSVIMVGALAFGDTPKPKGRNGVECSGGPTLNTLWIGGLTSVTRTDNDGRFRLEGVPPGRYLVVAGAEGGVSGQAGPPESCNVAMTMRNPVYHPGVSAKSSATNVSVSYGVDVIIEEYRIGPPPAPTTPGDCQGGRGPQGLCAGSVVR